MDDPKRLIILEGPAGAGKTTVIKQLLAGFADQGTDAELIEYPWRDPAKRTFEGLIGASEALGKDYYRMVKAIASLSSGTLDVAILDRCFISQFVYNRLVRAQGGRPTAADLINYMMITSHLTVNIPKLMALQGLPLFRIPAIIDWVIVCPVEGLAPELMRRRGSTGKTYPYDASTEINGFAWIWQNWSKANGLNALYDSEPWIIDGQEHVPDLLRGR